MTREAGFQRTAENEDQQHQGGQLNPILGHVKASPHWTISYFASKCVHFEGMEYWFSGTAKISKQQEESSNWPSNHDKNILFCKGYELLSSRTATQELAICVFSLLMKVTRGCWRQWARLGRPIFPWIINKGIWNLWNLKCRNSEAGCVLSYLSKWDQRGKSFLL